MDEKSGMNFSEYVAILSGNTDLLEKAKLEKKIAGLESERRSFMRSRQTSRSRLDEVLRAVDGNKELIARFKSDRDLFESRVQKDKDGNKLNPIQLKGVEGSDPKRIAAKLAEVKEHARTKGGVFRHRHSLRFQDSGQDRILLTESFRFIAEQVFHHGREWHEVQLQQRKHCRRPGACLHELSQCVGKDTEPDTEI